MNVHAVEHLAALLVDEFALDIDDIVVAQHLLPYGIMTRFDILLSAFYALADDLVGYGFVVGEMHCFGDEFHPVTAENPRHIVLHGHIENRAAGVTLTTASSAELIVYSATLVAFGAYDAQTSRLEDFLLVLVALPLELLVQSAVLFLGFGDFLVVVTVRRGRHFDDFGRVLSELAVLGPHAPLHLLARHVIGVAAQHDVRAAPRHVGGYRNRLESARLRDDCGFLFVVLGVQHAMPYALSFEHIGQFFRFLDADGADEDGLSSVVALLDVGNYGVQLAAVLGVDFVVLVAAEGGLVGRNGDDIEGVYALEFLLFRLGGARHARQLGIHPEEVLESDCGKRPVLAADRHSLLGFDCLVQSFVVAPAYHYAPRELVDDEHLAVRHDVIAVALHHIVRLESLPDVVIERGVVDVGEVVDAEISFGFGNALVGEHNGFLLLLDDEIARAVLVLFLPDRARESVGLLVDVARLLPSARNDERGARLVDENGVHLVDYGEIEFALHLLFLLDHHVVAQEVEAQFVVGAVGYVAVVRRALGVGHAALFDYADGQPHETVHLAHPRRVALGEIVVDGDDVHALARQRVEISRQCGDESLAFARAHLGDTPLMKGYRAHYLHEERLHSQHTPRRFAHRRISVGHDVVESLAVFQPAFEGGSDGGELLVRKRGVLVRQFVHLERKFTQFAHLSFVFVENACHYVLIRRAPRARGRALPFRYDITFRADWQSVSAQARSPTAQPCRNARPFAGTAYARPSRAGYPH